MPRRSPSYSEERYRYRSSSGHSSYSDYSRRRRSRHRRSPSPYRSRRRRRYFPDGHQSRRSPSDGYDRRRSIKNRSPKRSRQGVSRSYPKENALAQKGTIAVLHDIPSNVTEDILESAVRTLAISLGFSPPNFVKCVKAGAQITGLVEFPSTDSAEIFFENASKLKIENKHAKVTSVVLPPGTLTTMASVQVTTDWEYFVKCLEKKNEPSSASNKETGEAKAHLETFLGPEIPLPKLEEFILDHKSGLLYNETYQLYFEPVSQQYMSPSGVYYMKNNNPFKPALVPIYRISTAMTNIAAMPADTVLNQTHADQVKNAILIANSSTPIEPPSPVSPTGPPTIDSAASKATAVASVLAAAQMAAAATKKVTKPKLSHSSVVNKESSSKEFEQSASSTVESQQIIQSLFNPNDDDSFLDENPLEEHSSNIAPNKEVVEEAVIEDQYICYVCIRQFKSEEFLRKHETLSQFHKKNCEIQRVERVHKPV